MSGLRPAESLTVQSIKDLKQKIEKIRYITGASYCKYIRKSHVFDLLNSFEASLRGRLEELEHKTIVVPGEDDITNFEQTILEIRMILDGGGGHD